MRRTPLRLVLASLLVLGLGAPALAQRRVVAPPGQKAPPADAPEEQKKDEKKKDDKKDEAAQAPADSRAPVKAAEEPKADADKPAEAAKPARPVIPNDERQSASKKDKDKTVVVPTEAQEVVYRKKADKTIVTLHVRPAKPVPGKLTTFIFEVTQLLDVPDPELGDRRALENADLTATVTSQAKGGATVRRTLRPLSDAGTYGMHFVAPEAAGYKLELSQHLENAEIGDQALNVEFTVGIGVATDMKVAEDDDSAQKSRRGRTAIKVVSTKAKGAAPGNKGDGPEELMHELGEKWLDLETALDDPKANPGDLAAQAKAISELAAKVDNTVPLRHAIATKEYDLYAGQLSDALKALPAATADRAKAKAVMASVQDGQCLKCHTRFRYDLTDDVGHWPKFTPKEPSEKKSRR